MKLNSLFSTIFIVMMTMVTANAEIFADITILKNNSFFGTVRVRLNYDKAPRMCANFIRLATGKQNWIDENYHVRENTPYYTGRSFHYLLHNRSIRGGALHSNGTGTPGYYVQDEYDDDLKHDDRYIISMVNSGTNSCCSEFMIVLRQNGNPFFNSIHHPFGEVINDPTFPNSQTIIDSFTDPNIFPTNNDHSPVDSIKIGAINIVRTDAAAQNFNTGDPNLRLPKITKLNLERVVVAPNHDFILGWNFSRNTSLTPEKKLERLANYIDS